MFEFNGEVNFENTRLVYSLVLDFKIAFMLEKREKKKKKKNTIYRVFSPYDLPRPCARDSVETAISRRRVTAIFHFAERSRDYESNRNSRIDHVTDIPCQPGHGN